MRKLVTLSIVVLVCAALGGVATSTAQANRVKVKSHHIYYTRDFITATNVVGFFYGNDVENWLVNCSSSEGGHGGWVWFGHAKHAIFGRNTPGGWMQFMESTFDSNVGWAFQDAQARGLRVNPKARSYYEPLGQAIVAGAMYHRSGNPGTWTGAQC